MKLSRVAVMLSSIMSLTLHCNTKLIIYTLAHHEAHSTGILHHDISPGNIILTNSGGLLIDWDMCKDVNASQTQRCDTWTGTWQFMSAALVSAMFTPMTHMFVDNMESSLWVLMWIFLMYSLCSNNDQAVLFFDNTLEPRTRNRQGGYNKADWLNGGTFSNEVCFDGCPALDELIKWLMHLLVSRYEPPLDKSDQEMLRNLHLMKENDPQMFSSLKLKHHPIWSHAMHLESLSSHAATIDIYSSALGDGDIDIKAWGPPVPAQKQDL